jgi:hypothetical protein
MKAKKAIAASVVLIAAGGAIAACGDDNRPTPAQPQATPAPPGGGAPAGGAGSGSNKLAAMVHVEDLVDCPPPTNAKACDPSAPQCDKGSYCLPVAPSGAFCGPCPERDAIRHSFKDRDFVDGETMRDPFRAGIGPQVPAGGGSGDIKVITDACKPSQLVATNYSFMDLKLVGIVAQGTQRKVLMMDGGNPPLGQIIKLRDCVGKEKAIVKDIGAGYVTFQVTTDNSGTPKVEERSVQLHPTQVTVTSLPSDSPISEEKRATNAPLVAPPSAGEAPRPPPPPPGTTQTTTTTTTTPGSTVIIPSRNQQNPGYYVPPPPPTTLHP